MPCVESFLEQDEEYRNSVLPPDVRARVVVEAASPLGWDRIATDEGEIVGMTTFGASGPAKDLYKHFGFTAENVAEVAKKVAERNAE
jgi:transketolase